jgi:hypothetical protein
MSYEAKAFNLMIASPGDVKGEREIVREVVHEWNGMHSEVARIILIPIGWETHSAPVTGGRGQSIINSQILSRSDLLVAMFWTRIGTPTEEAVSGTAEEIQKHVSSGKPSMIYFSNAPVRPDSVEEEQYRLLKEFKDWCYNCGLIETYDGQQEFRDKFRRQLATLINTHKYFAGQRQGSASQTLEGGASGDSTFRILSMTAEAQKLLQEAATSVDGVVGKIAYGGGAVVQVNGRNCVEPNSPRSRAAWEGAIDELVSRGLLAAVGQKGQMFRITRDGYVAADALTTTF